MAGSAHVEATSLPERDWLSVSERGTLLGIRFVFWLATLLGRAPARLFLRGLAAYYVLFDRQVTEASRSWWRRVEGKEPSLQKIYEHVRRFANVSLDRVFLLQGRARPFHFTRTGDEHLARLAKERRGAILLGAHLGSFEAMRYGGQEDQVQINIVGDFRNARMINRLLERLNPGQAARVIHVDPKDPGFIFAIQERIEAGEFVALLGDRVTEGQSSVSAEFFGQEARFPAGPFQIAALLKCPVYLTFGVYEEPSQYHLSCELFAERLELPRARRQEALEETVQRFARRLEERARAAPDNWFNFYDFWGEAELR